MEVKIILFESSMPLEMMEENLSKKMLVMQMKSEALYISLVENSMLVLVGTARSEFGMVYSIFGNSTLKSFPKHIKKLGKKE